MPSERLSKYDAIFYFTDNRRVAMQVSVGMVVAGPIDFDRYRAWVAPRIAGMPKLKMCLKPTPFGLRLPAWTPAAHFDISEHLTAHTLSSPGNDEQLRSLMRDLRNDRLPHDKPLWHLHVVNGLINDRAALFLTSHHCMADAEGIMEMFTVLLETSAIADVSPVRVSKAGLTREAHAQRPLHGLRALVSRDGRRRLGMLAQYARTKGPRFPFTRPVSGTIDFAWRRIPQEQLRAISRAFGTTATDVMLAALGVAMDAYAAKQNVPVAGKNLLLQIPANVRLPDKYGKLGNELAMLPGVVPLGIADPVERLRTVAEFNRTLKALDMAPLIHGMMGMAFGMATPPGQAVLCRTMVSAPYLRIARALGLPPQEHALMSSIMMPPIKYSVDGQPIEAFINLIACQFNMGFAFSPVAYEGTVTLTLSVDAKNLGAADPVMEDFVAGIAELYARAGNVDGAATG